MKLAYNPLGQGAYTPAPSYKDDIIFDLVTRVTYVKGVPFYGKKYEYFKKHTSPDNTGGSEGLVPAPSYTTTNTRLLREDGEWVHIPGASLPDNMLDINSTNTVENQAVAKEIQKLNAQIILKAEHVYKNIVVNGVLIQAQGTNDTLEFIQGDGIALTPNPDDKTIIISTKVLGQQGIDTYYASGQLVVKVDDLYYNHWNETYNWYRSVTDEDTDVYINKWQEIVDFLNNVQSGTNILDEFVTRKTPQEIIGAKTFTQPITSSVTLGTAPFIITSPTLVTNLNSDLWDGKHLYKPFEDSEGIDSSALLWESNGASTGLTSMQYAMVLNVNAGDAHGRRWQIWNSRNNHQLYWRPELPDMSGYAPEHILLDSLNYKGFIEQMYWANISIQSVSDPNTSPTFLNATTTGMLQTNLIRDLAGNWLLGQDPETANLSIGTTSKNHYIALQTTTADNEVFINDQGNTGIGTKTPIAKLHVVGTTRLDGQNYIISFSPNYNDTWSDGTNTHPWYGYDHRYERTGVYSTVISDYYGMTLKTAQCNISITSSNVGIGTFNPTSKLHIVHNSNNYLNSNNALHIIDNTTYSQTRFVNMFAPNLQVSSSTACGAHIAFGVAQSAYNFGYIKFWYAGAGSISNAIRLGFHSADNLVSIVGNGNVGIGTTAPKSKLSVYAYSSRPTLGKLGSSGTVEIGTTGSYGTYFWTEGSGRGFIQQGRADNTATAYDLILQVLGGNVGIGTDSPVYKLDVAGKIRALTEIKVQGSTSPVQQPCVNWHDENTTGFHVSYRLTETGKPLRFYYQTTPSSSTTSTYTQLVDITSTGSVGIGTTAPIHKLQVAGAGVFNNTGSTSYTTNGITIGAGDAVARYITCYGKTGLSYINIGYNAAANNSGELHFSYSSSGSTSNYVGLQLYGAANCIRIYPGYTQSIKYIQAPNYVSSVATGTQPYACTSTTLNTNLNADLLDGYHANYFLPRMRMTNPSNGTSYHGAIPYAIALKSAGTPLYTDPEFASGNNSVSVYNNSGNGVVTITRVADSSAANSSGYVLKIVNSGGTSTPGRGGFLLGIGSRQNAVFAQIFRAKVPTGYTVRNAENSMGSGYTTFWLTDQAGTGKWEWYIRITICGSGGSYSSGGHVYLEGSGAVTWYLAYANVIDLTKGNYDGLRVKYCEQSSTVTVNNSDANSTYRMVWHSGNTLYGTAGIYCNPSSDYLYATSMQASSWFRSTGSTGWYNGSYGGGIYMEDSTYVRTYNSKAFYVSNTGDHAIYTAGGFASARTSGSVFATYYNGTWYRDTLYTHGNGNLSISPPGGSLYLGYNRGSVYFCGSTAYVNRSSYFYAVHYYETSDIRKKNILNYIEDLKLEDIPIISFTWKNDSSNKHIGSIAQEVEKILPEVVETGEDGYKSIDYGVLGTVSGVMAIKQLARLQEKIKELEKEIEILKNKN